ncbi:uncharacterized protein LOC106136812 [Amyelois transitella]|uniref:uncharacterized protein LOC106136812 n=1 Tax=Amyelois transitella TaxID=680683 RepID=UPI00067E3279|nr:uncharacterized protein LOC106136812 [Amyelois transitella]
MDQQQCPVCTLFLHNGMTLESHLDTHPKDQVIKALCSLANKGSSYGSRTSTPVHSERSYRSRSRTPATTEDRWNSSHRNSDHDKYWRRTPSRPPKSNSVLSSSRNATPDIRIGDINFESNTSTHANQFSGAPFVMKTDRVQNSYPTIPEFEQQYIYMQDPQDDREIKYSRSAEYTALNSNSAVFSHNMPAAGPAVKLQTTLLPPVQSRGPDIVKVMPKPNNILVKTNVSGVQYIAPSVKPMHVVVPTSRTFLHKNIQNNMIVSNSLPTGQMVDTKCISGAIPSSQFSQIPTGAFTPGTTVVTQNSQIIYQEMVHNLDGKPFVSSIPAVLTSHENVTNVAQTSSVYQNVMVVDQFGNSSCMYTTPQQIIPKACNSTVFTTTSNTSSSHVDKTLSSRDANKTLIIEVAPIVSKAPANEAVSSTTLPQPDPSTPSSSQSGNDNAPTERIEAKSDSAVTTKGLKILSNIKVEVPVQHHKNMLNTIMDLTGSNDPDYPERCPSPEKILPDLEDSDNNQLSEDTQPSASSADSLVSHTFSVIKNVGNPPAYKENSNKSTVVDSKIDTEFSDSCPVPDLICNEKPSVSPCSELSEQGDNSTDRRLMSPKPHSSQSCSSSVASSNKPVVKTYRNNTLRLNNIYVKKHKKILQIKNAKPFPLNNDIEVEIEPRASSSNKSPEHYTMNKMHQPEKIENKEKTSKLKTVSVEQIVEKEDQNDDHDFDADTEEQSMDIEPEPSTVKNSFTTSIDVVQVKEEVNTSNEESFSNEASGSNRGLTPLETLRPINVIAYSHLPGDEFDEESNHRELLELEATSKNKQFVSMMNDNYFGDNIYADYFTPDRVESFDTDRGEASFSKETQKDGIYIWGESSQKENEFVLPNFVHESYKVAESSGIDYSEMREESGERDSKADVLSESRSSEAPLNIRADEKMPPRGELSGQESNGDMESPWTGMYTEVTPAEPYDLIARESWVSDGSEVDPDEKADNLGDELRFAKSRLCTCTQCGAKFSSPKELRSHKSLAHALPTCSSTKTSYSRMVTARTIKKEEKIEESLPTSTLLTLDSKKTIATTILQVYDVMNEAKPKIEALIKQEPKRRRKDYVCPTCKVDQLTELSFHAHLKIHPLECLTCGKCFFRRANLALHMKTHLGIKNYKCEVCEKRFVTRQKLMEHHNAHTGRAPVKCTVCDDTFRRYSNMVQHRDRHHFQKKAKVRDFVCRCGLVFHSRAKLQWHAETHEERPKACLYCSDKFVHAASLTRHVRRAHNDCYTAARRGSADNVPCPVCKQVYLRTNLRAHLQTHSGKRPFLCIICNKAFTTKWNLKLHRWTHMSRSAKPFKCTLCKGAFIRQTEYISHMNAHKSVKPYTCNYCGCQFIRKYNCQRHVREHEMAKKYVCKVPECGKSFHRSYYLSEHMKVHSGARPFSCNICGKTSSNKSNHNKHVKIHHTRESVATEA